MVQKRCLPRTISTATAPGIGRRDFLRTAGCGGLSLAGLLGAPIEQQIARASEKVNRNSRPSDLRITDLRVAEITGAPMRVPILRIDTNQGLSGYGEVRDGGDWRYALMLKSRLLRENPCNVEKVFKKLKQFGHHGRQGGGVSGVEMALWDLAGKAFGVPVYQMLGGKYRDRIRLYADTPSADNPEQLIDRLKERLAMGLTMLKMDVGISLVRDVAGTLTRPLRPRLRSDWGRMHPFSGIQLTAKGIAQIVDHVMRVRQAIGWEVPLAADHFGPIGVNSCIRLGRALTDCQLAWLEDMIPWQLTDQWQQITQAVDLPTLTGEDIYLKHEFVKLIDAHAVDMVHPDLATAGGILETKRIGDYAEQHGVPMAMHFAGSPISLMANVHCAAATQNVVALEHHSLDIPWWEDLVTGIDKPLQRRGFVRVPDSPGLGVELNEPVVREHLRAGQECFAPTPQWNTTRSHDRLWS